MFGNYRIISFGGVLLVCVLIAGLVVFCLRDAKSNKAKSYDTSADSLATAGKDIKSGVQSKDSASVQAISPISIKQKEVALAYKLGSKGGKMTPDEAAKLEKKLAKNPDDLNVAVQLLGFYFLAHDDDAREKSEKLILSLIQSHPEAAIFETPYANLNKGLDNNYAEAQKLWAQQVEYNPENTAVLMNAAASALSSDKAVAEKYFLQAQALDPDNPEISERLARGYRLSRYSDKGTDKSDLAAKELAELTKAYNNSDSINQDAMLPYMTIATLEIPGELDLADRNADLMISMSGTSSKDWNTGNLFYYGYFTKGMVALKNGNADKAAEVLLKSAETSGSPQLNSFGPNMSLAKALLEAGQKDAVIEFLGKCGKFWKNDQSEKWVAEIKDGKTPDFGGRLYY